jgi:hypothetical protein
MVKGAPPNYSLPDKMNLLSEKNISTICPYCLDKVALIPAHDPINHGEYSYFIALCPNRKRKNCKPIFAVYEFLNDRIFERYPIPSLYASSIHEAIPENIREDYAEVLRCFYIDSHKATVIMCRRVMEALACDKLGQKAKDKNGKIHKLFTLIDLLYDDRKITKELKDSAHELRLFGNYGAHVQKDGLDKIESQEAKEIKEITWLFLYSLYITPFKTNELRKSRISKSNP